MKLYSRRKRNSVSDSGERMPVLEKGYLELVRRFRLRPIRGAKDLAEATTVIDELIRRRLSPEEADYLDALSDLVAKYESEHHPIPDSSPVDMLPFFIEDRKTNQRAVALASGIATSTMSQIFSGQRQMNLGHMQKFAAHFGLDVAAFLPEKKTAPEGRRGKNVPRS